MDSRSSIFLSFVHLVAELYGAGEVAANSVRPQSPSRVTVTPRVARAANAACIFADKPCRPPTQIQITAVNKRRGVKGRRARPRHLGRHCVRDAPSRRDAWRAPPPLHRDTTSHHDGERSAIPRGARSRRRSNPSARRQYSRPLHGSTRRWHGLRLERRPWYAARISARTRRRHPRMGRRALARHARRRPPAARDPARARLRSARCAAGDSAERAAAL